MNCIVLSCQFIVFTVCLQSDPQPCLPSFSLYASFDEVSTESDIHVYIITVNCVLPLPLVQADPHLVAQLQVQHQALALHDGAVAGLGVHDGPLRVVLHDVKIRLFEVPRVNVDIEVVDPRDVAEEFPLEHVEVVVQVDEDRVEHKRLVGVQAVDGFATADREGRVVHFAGVSWKTRLALSAFGAHGTYGAWRAFVSSFTWCSSLATISFVTCTE